MNILKAGYDKLIMIPYSEIKKLLVATRRPPTAQSPLTHPQGHNSLLYSTVHTTYNMVRLLSNRTQSLDHPSTLRSSNLHPQMCSYKEFKFSQFFFYF